MPSRVNNEWFQVRKNNFKRLEAVNGYSPSLKMIIKSMMKSEPKERISLESLLEENYNKIQLIYFREKVADQEEKMKELKERIEKVKGKKNKMKRKSSIS